MVKKLRKLTESIENYPTGFWLWLAAFSGIIVLRLLVENWLTCFQNRSGLFIFYEFTHTFLFFLIAYLLFLWILHKFLKIDFKKVSNVLLWGYLLIVSPPIFDFIISRGQGFWSFYKFDSVIGLFKRFFTFFGDKPEIGITYGVRIEIALALFFIFIYSLIKSKNVFKSLSVSVLSYLVFFVLGTFPSWIAIIFKGFSKGLLKVSDVDVARMFLTPAKIFSREIPDIVSSLNIKMSLVYSLLLVLLLVAGCLPELLRKTKQAGLLFSREKILSFIANARYPQLIYHAGLIFVGIGLALVFTDASAEINFFNISGLLVLLAAISCAWLASVAVNDIQDKKIDELANPSRPLIKELFAIGEYKNLGLMLFILSILFSAIVNFKIALFLIAYQAVAWIYSAWPLRLKRLAFISTFVSAIASLMILFSGFILVSPDQSIKSLPFSIIALLVIGYTLSLPIKDFKDVEGDKKNGVYSVPVLFGEYWGKIIVGVGLFISFMLSVVIFNEPRLFWWALLGGAISFWIILSSGQNKSIAYKRLPWWIMGVVVLYGMILVKIVFF